MIRVLWSSKRRSI